MNIHKHGHACIHRNKYTPVYQSESYTFTYLSARLMRTSRLTDMHFFLHTCMSVFINIKWVGPRRILTNRPIISIKTTAQTSPPITTPAHESEDLEEENHAREEENHAHEEENHAHVPVWP